MSAHNRFLTVQTLTPRFFVNATQFLLKYTLYDMMCMSPDFTDVKSALDERTDWSIELFRSCLTIHFINGDSFFLFSTLTFLLMAEAIYLHYGRRSPQELQKCAESMGYAAFAIMFALLDVGVIVVRIAGIATLSQTPGLAASLVLVSMVPSAILPSFVHIAGLVKRMRGTTGDKFDVESGIVVDENQD